jgi:hypothetical protein
MSGKQALCNDTTMTNIEYITFQKKKKKKKKLNTVPVC